jgi:hypothetical protein
MTGQVLVNRNTYVPNRLVQQRALATCGDKYLLNQNPKPQTLAE